MGQRDHRKWFGTIYNDHDRGRRKRRTKLVPGVIAVACGSSAIIAGTFIHPMVSAASTRIASLKSVSGTVQVTRKGSFRKISAFKGMHLQAGDEIITGDNGTATIVYTNGTTSSIGTDSDVTLGQAEKNNQGYQISVKVWSGNLWSQISSLLNAGDKYDVETPTMVMGVRGTMFDVYVPGGGSASTLSVLDGIVGADANNGTLPRGGILADALQAAQQTVTVHNQLSANDNAFVPSPQTLNMWGLVQHTDPTTLVTMASDMMNRMTSDHTSALKQEQAFKSDITDLNSLNDALMNANKALILSKEGQELLNTIQYSGKAQDVNQVLLSQGETLSFLLQELISSQTTMEQTLGDVTNLALNTAGYSQDRIEQLAPPLDVSTAGDWPPPPPRQQPEPPTNDTGNDTGNEVSNGTGNDVGNGTDNGDNTVVTY